jgi:hypothetical protein
MQALSLEESVVLNSHISSTKTSISISVPISIPKNNSFESDLPEQYSLKSNIFNPSKMSPPDYWRCRLEQRLKDHQVLTSDKK